MGRRVDPPIHLFASFLLLEAIEELAYNMGLMAEMEIKSFEKQEIGKRERIGNGQELGTNQRKLNEKENEISGFRKRRCFSYPYAYSFLLLFGPASIHLCGYAPKRIPRGGWRQHGGRDEGEYVNRLFDYFQPVADRIEAVAREGSRRPSETQMAEQNGATGWLLVPGGRFHSHATGTSFVSSVSFSLNNNHPGPERLEEGSVGCCCW